MLFKAKSRQIPTSLASLLPQQLPASMDCGNNNNNSDSNDKNRNNNNNNIDSATTSSKGLSVVRDRAGLPLSVPSIPELRPLMLPHLEPGKLQSQFPHRSLYKSAPRPLSPEDMGRIGRIRG